MARDLIYELLTTKGSTLGDDRLERDILYLSIARLVSYRGTCNRGGRAGALIVKDGRIISLGYVGSPPKLPHCLDSGCIIDKDTGGCIRTQHAEANAIAWAARMGLSIEDSTMYCTLQPCLLCSKLIVMSGIKKVLYLDQYRDDRGTNYLESCGVITHHYIKK